MRRFRHALVLVAGAVILGLVTEAGAADFSPTIDFKLGETKTSVNTTLETIVKQDQGEEELQSVVLQVPAGFSLAVDQQLTDGEKLGGGTIMIAVGACPAAGAPANIPVNIIERNRNSSEIARGVEAVYVVDLRPVTTIQLLVYGSTAKGWRLEGDIPSNAATCPPFTFDATFLKQAEMSKTPIIVNPSSGGTYKFEATFKGVGGGEVTLEKSVEILGDGGGGGTITDNNADAKKKCKRIKKKKKRRRCLNKLKG